MTTFEEKTLFYITVFSEMAREENCLGLDMDTLLKQSALIFCLTNEETGSLKKLMNHTVFKEINNTFSADCYFSSLERLKGANIFGENVYERQAIKTKKRALEFYEKLKESDFSIMNALEKNVENNRKVAVMFALYHYFLGVEIPSLLLSRLRKNGLDKEYSDVDSLLLLLSVDPVNTAQYQKFLTQSSAYRLNKNEFSRLNIEKKETETYECKYNIGNVN